MQSKSKFILHHHHDVLRPKKGGIPQEHLINPGKRSLDTDDDVRRIKTVFNSSIGFEDGGL
jgi:hypothetical protein